MDLQARACRKVCPSHMWLLPKYPDLERSQLVPCPEDYIDGHSRIVMQPLSGQLSSVDLGIILLQNEVDM